MYYMITVSDGDVCIEELDKEGIAKAVADSHESNATFLKSIHNGDPQYWGSYCTLIIKGEIVVPKPKTTITEYVID